MTINLSPYKIINDFKSLFEIVCTNHQGPAIIDLGRQMQWNGITAGQCAGSVRFIQADGINAILNTKTNCIRFSEGSPDKLEEMLQKLAANN